MVTCVTNRMIIEGTELYITVAKVKFSINKFENDLLLNQRSLNLVQIWKI